MRICNVNIGNKPLFSHIQNLTELTKCIGILKYHINQRIKSYYLVVSADNILHDSIHLVIGSDLVTKHKSDH